MSETTAFNMRIDAQLKQKAEELFNDLGLSMSDAVRLFFSQSIKEQAIPFSIYRPNATTIRSLLSKDIEYVGTVDDLRKKYAHLHNQGRKTVQERS